MFTSIKTDADMCALKKQYQKNCLAAEVFDENLNNTNGITPIFVCPSVAGHFEPETRSSKSDDCSIVVARVIS